MIFSSLLFLFRFLPIALAVYYLAPANLKNAALFLISIVFYSWGEVRYFPVMLSCIVGNYLLALCMGRWEEKPAARRFLLVLTVVFNIGMLFFFKYTDFFLRNLNALFGTNFAMLNLTLPLGISFYTFQTMSYTLDVYKRTVKPERNIIDLGAYVVMFPQLIAGPIVLYKDVAAQLKVKKGRCHASQIDEGAGLFVLGLAKKVLLANSVGALWTDVQNLGYANVSTPLAWLGAIAFTLQIYFDFSGYSTMAIGLGKMLGFEFPQNFNLPYISRSITDFWRRWHMTLSGWFREYVYIPLGGNRRGKRRQILNLLIVWCLTGFWHGAEWNFLLWGLYYFVLLTIEKLWLQKPLANGRVWPHIYALFFIVVGWAIFAVDSGLTDLAVFLGQMFLPSGGVSAGYFVRNYGVSLAVAAFCSTPLPGRFYQWLCRQKWQAGRILVLGALLLLSVAYLVDSTYNPFIYFRF
ncbi:MAG: MBOAT family protein [Pygmaiobacter massiliensis]|nr:MBOAT family protein [Pygmaiobacter massiliensis]